jgi:uncharacterized membrane protein YphA (DoxX/SURF4 family)
MPSLRLHLDRLERRLTRSIAQHGILFLRVSVGIVFVWFGALKLFPGLSPAEDLAARTVSALTFGLVPPGVSVPVLGVWECAIGFGIVTGRLARLTLVLLLLQMSGTVMPLFFFPHETWLRFPYAATLEGQYIIKNVVLVSAGAVIYASLRGRSLAAQPALPRPRVHVAREVA